MLSENSPSQSIRYGIPSIFLYPSFDEVGIILGQETFLVSFVGEVDDDEPCGNGNDLNGEALNNLSLVRFVSHVCLLWLTNIHCQPLIPPMPSIFIRPYARTFEIPPTFTENR